MDDLMDEGSNDKNVMDIFTKHSHHQNITVIYLCQDISQRKIRQIHLSNVHYVVVFKNPRDQLGLRNLLLQSFLTRGKKSWIRSEK